MDSGASPNAKDDGSEENARWTYRQDAEANRGCHAAKGFQHGTIARLASLRFGKQPASRCVEAPPSAGLLYLKRRHVHAGRFNRGDKLNERIQQLVGRIGQLSSPPGLQPEAGDQR